MLVVVLTDDGIVAGALDLATIDTDGDGDDAPDPSRTVDDVAALAPPTIRPNVPAKDVVRRFRDDDEPWLLVTTAKGRYLGAVYRDRLFEIAEADELP